MENTEIKGKKLNMSQVFGENGKVIPVTVIEVTDKADASLEGMDVVVIGKSKGKGFTGVMKRWGFHGGPATRGQGITSRTPGSIGSQTPGRVLKGKKMAGRKGNARVTIKGLKIVKVDIKDNLVYVSGPVPGARNSKIILEVLNSKESKDES
ncbi:MAG: 50S ribosomal protein L3 [Patescibacteria group bacterium]|nr:50S ribosomal protein L3 [Patescibacteria group bacterium]